MTHGDTLIFHNLEKIKPIGNRPNAITFLWVFSKQHRILRWEEAVFYNAKKNEPATSKLSMRTAANIM